MRKYFLILSFLFGLNLVSSAQNAPETYQKAVELLNSSEYQAAQPLFQEFSNESKYGNLSNYASFHLAECFLKLNQPEQAINALKIVALKDWPKSDESKYLLGLAYFQNQQNLEALRVFKWIKNQEIFQLAESASFENLKKTSVSFLIAHLQEFKENGGYRASLKSELESQSILSASEKAAFYEIDGKRQESSQPGRSKDEVIDIVVILPFTNAGNASVSELTGSDFVVELYQGLSYGVTKLREAGNKINLLTFDSKRDPVQVQSFLNDPAVAGADVIIGPIYPEETDLVSAFAEKQKIPFIHPLSNIGDRFLDSQYSYLFRPSIISLSAGILKGLEQEAWGKKVAIGYSSSSRDEKLALTLQEELTKAGFLVSKSQKIDSKNVASFLKGLGVSRGNNPSVDQVILLTDDPSIAQPTFALMESISTSVPLLVMDSWLGFNFANFEMLEYPNFYFIGNNTPQFGTKEMNELREDFFSKNLIYPSVSAIQGYDLMNWLKSNISSTLGMDLRRSLDINAFQPGHFTWGYNFRKSNNNQYVPVFRLESGELKPIE
jgi:hypothetical protein